MRTIILLMVFGIGLEAYGQENSEKIVHGAYGSMDYFHMSNRHFLNTPDPSGSDAPWHETNGSNVDGIQFSAGYSFWQTLVVGGRVKIGIADKVSVFTKLKNYNQYVGFIGVQLRMKKMSAMPFYEYGVTEGYFESEERPIIGSVGCRVSYSIFRKLDISAYYSVGRTSEGWLNFPQYAMKVRPRQSGFGVSYFLGKKRKQ